MSVSNNKSQLSIVNHAIDSQDIHNFKHPWGIDPVIYLEQVRQQSRTNKFLKLQESLTNIAHLSTSDKEQQEETIHEITNILENLKTMRSSLLILNPKDIESATEYGKEIMTITTDLLLRVVHEIGQTNVRTRTLESILAYIRNLMHTRSAHMRQTIPGPLLIAWYQLSDLMSSMQNEPELKITNKKALQLQRRLRPATENFK